MLPPDDPFWELTIGDPGPDDLFDPPVYDRGAMTLHQLRLAVGDADFFADPARVGRTQAGGNVTTDEFIALAEQVSGQQLDALFDDLAVHAGTARGGLRARRRRRPIRTKPQRGRAVFTEDGAGARA